MINTSLLLFIRENEGGSYGNLGLGQLWPETKTTSSNQRPIEKQGGKTMATYSLGRVGLVGAILRDRPRKKNGRARSCAPAGQ